MTHAFFFDMDGTLYETRRHAVSPLTLYALKQLQNHGYRVSLISSRSLHEMDNLESRVRAFPFDALILEGGALVLDRQDDTRQTFPMDPALVEPFARYAADKGLVWRFSTLEGNYFGSDPTLFERYIMNRLYLNAPVRRDFDPQQDAPLNILVWVSGADEKQAVRDFFPGHSIVEYPDCLEIRAPGISKENALEAMRQKYRYSDVICFGDGNNDAGMLEAADTGVAMGNASTAAKEAADYIIGPIEEDGIYHFLCEQRIIPEMSLRTVQSLQKEAD